MTLMGEAVAKAVMTSYDSTPKSYPLTSMHRDHCIVGGCASLADEWVTITVDVRGESFELDIPVCTFMADMIWPDRIRTPA